MRALLIGAVLLIASVVTAAAQTSAGQTTLKPQIVVERDMVRLGELFANLPPSADPEIEVARSPAPGQRLTLDASVLMTIATTQRVGWKPTSRFDRVTVERAGNVIGPGKIHDAIVQALADRGLPQNADLVLDNERLQLIVAANQPTTVRVETLSYDPQKPRFEATLVAPADDPNAERVKVQGKVFQTVDMPVPVRPIAAGEIIHARDIEMVRLRIDQVGPTNVNDPDKLLDKSARRVLPAGQPVRVSDINAPILVARNGIVNVKIASKQLSIVMQGKALDEGAEGDTVRVVNTRSNKVVQGVVSGHNEVTVMTAYSMVSN